jgi:putative ABC transport system substrate-binding protein
MRRREFITVGAAVAVWPLAARAQRPARLPTIGYLHPATPSTRPEWTAVFLQRLRELGWIDGRTVAIEHRYAVGHKERYTEITAEFVRLKVDVIVTQASEPVIAPKQVTSLIPIIFSVAGDPVGTGLVASLARPGGNVTGLSNQAPDLAAKRLEFLREIFPGLSRLAVLLDINNPASVATLDEVQTAARTLGIEAVAVQIKRPEDIGPAFEAPIRCQARGAPAGRAARAAPGKGRGTA